MLLTRVGFLCHRAGVNPENFLRVLEKTQLSQHHKQAIMQVAALPGVFLSSCWVGWVVRPVLTADTRVGLRHPSPLLVANPAFLPQKVQSYEGRPMLADEFQKLFDEVDKGVVKEVSRSGLCHLPSPGPPRLMVSLKTTARTCLP